MLERNNICLQAIFKHMIPGDDALLQMSAVFFKRLGVGAEIYPYPADSIPLLYQMVSSGCCCTAHLAHSLVFTEQDSQDQLVEYGKVGSGKLRGMVVHDNRAISDNRKFALDAVRTLSRRLSEVDSPLLFIEYACGLDPQDYLSFIAELNGLPCVGACIDIGHVAVAACRREYRRLRGEEIFSLKIDSPELPQKIEYVEQAVKLAREQTVLFSGEAASLGVPLHFHLHDAHPLSWFSPYGVRDHLPFFWQIPLPFEYRGRFAVDCIFGYSGLREVLRQVIHSGVPRPLSLMLEIHPQAGEKPLGEYEGLFEHWPDKTNARRHLYWLELISTNVSMLRQALADVCGD